MRVEILLYGRIYGRTSLGRILVVLVFQLLITSCKGQDVINIPYENREIKRSELFKAAGLLQEQSIRIDDYKSLRLFSDTLINKRTIFYLEELKSKDSIYLVVINKLKLEKLDPLQYVQFGSFDGKADEIQPMIAIEQYDRKEVPDTSQKIFDLWSINKKNQFIKLDEKKYHRVHDGFYLIKK